MVSLRHLAGMACLLAGCDFSASTLVVGRLGDTAGGGGDSADTADTDSDDSAVDTGAPDSDDTGDDSGVDTGGTDGDGDGWTVSGGDCDDDDPTTFPGAPDGCNGVDNDCDGTTDEDAAADDAYEPNDTTAYALGSLEDDPSRSLAATLTNDADVDRYQFTLVDDLTDFFTLTATLSNVPDDATFLFVLTRVRSDGDEALGDVASTTGSGTLELTYGDESFVEDGGDYQLVVSSLGGADCARTYLLSVAQ